jgi:tetratricopeptide (TPR) repeat protein
MHEGTPIQNAPAEARSYPKLSKLLGNAIDACVMGLAMLMPVWFLPFTLDILELNKQTLLVLLVMVALICWVAKSLLDRSFSLTRSWLHLVVLFFLLGYLVTSLFSLDPYISFVGNIGQMQWAFTTVAAFAVMYFIIVNRFRSTGRVYDALLWFLLGSVIAGLYGLLQILGVHPLGAWDNLAARNFNTVGTVNALATFLVIPTVIATALSVVGCTERGCYLGRRDKLSLFWKIVMFSALGIGLVAAIIVDFWPVWAALIFGMVVITGLRFLHSGKVTHTLSTAIPVVIASISVLFLIISTPIPLEIPGEVSPSAGHTWQIAKQTLRDAPLFGSGPGTWLYDYAKYRSVGVNLSQFWTIRFERGLTAFLTMLAMLGLVGTTLWLLLIVSGIVKSAAHLVRRREHEDWLAYLVVFTGWITTAFLAFLYNYNMAHHFAFWFLLALLGVLVEQGSYSWDQRSRGWVTGALSSILILFAVGAVSVMWLMGQRLVADAQYSSAVKAFERGDDISLSVKHLQSAMALNPLNDVYPRNLAQAHLVKVGRIIEQEPTEELINEVNANVASAVDAARKASEINPANVDNAANLAVVYQAISSFTRGADEFAIRNYEDALKLEPNNPVFMNEIGKLHVLRSDAYRTLVNASDPAANKEALESVNAELGKAEEWFNRAITTKPDYAAAIFNLGLVYERQGRLSESVGKFEEVLRLNPQDMGVAFQLAILYRQDGNRDAARDLFEQIIQAEPNYANAHWFLSGIYEEEGRLDDAIRETEAVMKTNPDNADVLKRLHDLREKKQGVQETAPAPMTEPLEEDIQSPEEQNPIQP